MEKENLYKFIEWLSLNIEDFKDKTPEEIVGVLNKKSSTEDGMDEISELINQFKNSSPLFKNGGKVNYLINKFKKGGKSAQRPSDSVVNEFHGVDLFEYGPNKYKTSRGYLVRDLKPGVRSEILPNGVGLRQITNNNITTTELVSPDKRDTLYIHNGVGGRVDSNIDDSGFLGILGLRKPTPVSSRYKELQNKFNVQKFDDGGETSKTANKKSNINNKEYELFPADTVGNVITRKIVRAIPDGYSIAIQKQIVGYPDSTSYNHFRSNNKTENKGYPVIAEINMPSKDKWLFNDKKDRATYNRLFEDLYNYINSK